MLKENPDRFAQRPGQMRHRRVHRNDQIHFCDNRCGVQKISQPQIRLNNRGKPLQARLITRRHGQLQIVKHNARHLQNRHELFQPERARGILVMFGIARPGQPDFQPARLRRRQPLAGRCPKIRRPIGNRVERAAVAVALLSEDCAVRLV